jgi:hypothetical protein
MQIDAELAADALLLWTVRAYAAVVEAATDRLHSAGATGRLRVRWNKHQQ